MEVFGMEALLQGISSQYTLPLLRHRLYSDHLSLICGMRLYERKNVSKIA